MTVNHKPTGTAASMPLGLLFGACISLGITLMAVALIAKLVSSEYIKESQIGYGIMVTLLAASFLGAQASMGRIKRRCLLVCALSGLVFFLILLSITGVFFGGQYEAVGVTGVLVLGGTLLAVLTCGRFEMRGKGKKIRKANR